MDNNDFDKLFRDGLNDPRLPFDEGGWEALEGRLDAYRRKRKKAPVFWIGLSGAAAAILLVCLFFLLRPGKPAKNTGTVAAVPNMEKTTPPAGEKNIAEGPKELPADIQTGKEAHRLATTIGDTADNRRILNPRRLISGRASLIDSLQQSALMSWQAPLSADHLFIVPGNSAADGLPAVVDKPKQPRDVSQKRPSTLSILAAPDLTSVQGAGDPQVSSNVGLLYTLPLTRKFSVSAGALYAKKNYNTPFSKYGRTFSKWYAPSDQIYANCDVLEIPLLVNYQVYDHKNTRIQIGAGLSSYFMLHEQYDFKEARNQPVFWSYEVSGKNQHPFGVGNLSVMVEQQVSRRFSIGLTPFIKLPLTGIGDGRVKLQSQGVAVSVNFMLGQKP